jgi:hypothetical protein
MPEEKKFEFEEQNLFEENFEGNFEKKNGQVSVPEEEDELQKYLYMEYEKEYQDRDGYKVRLLKEYHRGMDGKFYEDKDKKALIVIKEMPDGKLWVTDKKTVSNRYKVVLMSELEKEIKAVLEKQGFKPKGEAVRRFRNELIINTEYPLGENERAAVGIINSYDQTKSAAIVLYVEKDDKLIPAGIVAKRKHYGSSEATRKVIIDRLIRELKIHAEVFKTLWNAKVDFMKMSIWDKVRIGRPVEHKDPQGRLLEVVTEYRYPLHDLKNILAKQYPDGTIPFKELWLRLFDFYEKETRKTVKDMIISQMHREVEPLIKRFKNAKVKAIKL